MQRGWRGAAVAAVLGLGSAASAHELSCEKLINGVDYTRVSQYPATLEVRYLVYNQHPTAESTAVSAEDPQLANSGFRLGYSLPLTLGVGAWADSSFLLRVSSYEHCLELAGGDGRDDKNFDSTFRVTWPLGETQCSATLVCEPPQRDECDVNPEACGIDIYLRPTTRDEGFFKTHEQALGACLASGPVDLGALGQVTTLEQALGLLWSSPELYEDGQPRTRGDALRFDVGRQLLVSTCNTRVFGAPAPAEAEVARQALSGADCAALDGARQALEAFNSSGAERPQPEGFSAGPSTPVHAQRIADDFTRPSGLDCGGGSR